VEFVPSPAPLVAAFDAALPPGPDVVRRKMFGWPAAFVGGWMFASLHRESIVVRLPEADLAELLALPGAARFEPMPGRAMKGYGTLPPEMHEDGGAVRSWIERAYRAAAALPPKR
jgi:TfoX/Sxy family transcriptional regulator of competence genes